MLVNAYNMNSDSEPSHLSLFKKKNKWILLPYTNESLQYFQKYSTWSIILSNNIVNINFFSKQDAFRMSLVIFQLFY
jgi:hypothetical protein